MPKTTSLAGATLASLTAIPAADAETHGNFACNLHALTPEQRAIHRALAERLAGAVVQRREIATGYELRVDARKMPIVDLAAWIDGERKCCPFLGLGIDQEPAGQEPAGRQSAGQESGGQQPDGGPLWLRITGPQGVKEFLLAEMGGLSGSDGKR